MSFKEWLEGVTSHALVSMLPNNGNADWKRCDLRSKYSAMAHSCADLPPAGTTKKDTPKHAPEPKFMDKDSTGFGFDAADRRNAKPRSNLRHIDRRRKSVPLRTPEVYD